MAENIKINIDVESKSVSKLVKDLDGMNDKIKKATDPSSVKELNKEFAATKKQLDDIDDSAKKFSLEKIMEDTADGSIKFGKAVGKLEAELRRLYHTGQDNTDEFRAIQKEAAEMKSSMANLNREVNLLGSNDSMQHFAGGLGNVGNSLKSLDFTTAAKDAQALVVMSKNMNFSTATKTLKNLGSTFMSLGKALLTNPLFLIAAVIAAIVVVIVKLMEEVGVLQIAMDALGKYIEILMIPINLLIEGLKKLTDWFGWTDNAGDELAKNTLANNEKIMASNKRKNDSLITSMEHEIAMAKAAGLETSELERKKLEEVRNMRKEEVRLAAESTAAILKLKGKDSDEYKEQLAAAQELVKAFVASKNELEVFNVTQDTKDSEKKKKKTEDDLKAQEAGAAAYKAHQERLIAQAEATANAQEAINRRLEEFRINQIDNDIERERELQLFKERNEFADIDRKMLTDAQIEELERNHKTMMAQINQEAIDKQKVIDEKIIEDDREKQRVEDEERLLRIEEQDALLRELSQTKLQNDLDEIENFYAKQLEMADGNAELIAAIERKKAADIIKTQEEAAAAEKAINDAKKDAAIGATSNVLDALVAAAGEGSAMGKAAAIAGVTMDTIQGAMAAYASAMTLGPIAGPILGAASAAAVGVMGAVNIKKITSTPIPGGGSGGGGSVSPAIATAPDMPRETPGVNLYGSGGETSVSSSSGSVERGDGGSQTVRAVVSWTDIDAISNNDKNLRNEMQL